MADLTRRFDWSRTSVGAVENWPPTLLTTVNLLLASRHPMFLWWGPDLIQFYNDAYRPSIGFDKHPAALGQRGVECWPEIWPIIGPQIDGVMSRGESTWHRNQLVPISRDGNLQEVFWTYSYSPVRDEDGKICGTLVVCSETTDQVLGERRMRTLLAVTSTPGILSRDAQSVGASLIRTLASNPADIPFAALYSVYPDGRISLAGSTGGPKETLFAPETWPLRQVAKSHLPLTLNDVEQRVGKVSVEPWPESIENACLLPASEGDSAIQRVLLLGISPRLPFDTPYETFFGLVTQRIAGFLNASDAEQRRYQSERELQMQRTRVAELFQQVPAFLAVLRGPQFIFEMANPQYLELIGGRSVIGLPIREALPEVVDQSILELLDRVYQSGERFSASDFRVQLARTPGQAREERSLDFVYQPIRESDGAVSGVLVLGIDLTERKKIEQALEESRQEAQRRLTELEAVYSSAPIGLALFDPVEFRYLRLNERQAEIVGLPREQILGKGLTEIAPIDGLDDMFRQVAKGHPIKNALLEGELPMRPGEHRYWTVNYDPVFAPDGSVQAISAASLEITAQKRAEAALIQSEKLAAVGRLASSIAHEINNPLEAVTNLLYLMDSPALPLELRSYVVMAQQELARVSHITLQTLRFHRQSVRAQQVDLAKLLDEVIALFQRQLGECGVAVERVYRGSRPVLAYENDLRQVFTNFIENAKDAMPSQGGKIIVREREATNPRNGRHGVRVTIADNGYGMSEETRKHIFEPFFTTKEMTGTGLGLWVSAEILQKHHATVRLRSSRSPQRHGTVFTLFFPYSAFPEAHSPG